MTELTTQQRAFAGHEGDAFVRACPGGGKTRTIAARAQRISPPLPPRQGIAILSFTNSAIDEFLAKCRTLGLDGVVRHPNFVGTFDAFLRQSFIAPCGLNGVAVRPTVLDSWSTLSVDIRLRGQAAFAGPGVPLDRFDASTNTIDPSTIGHSGLRNHVQAHSAAYVQAARQRRLGLRNRGYVSAADVRVEVVSRLQDPNWSTSLGRAIAARFKELIVDEAQDCNPLDLQLLGWLRDHGLAVTIVADLDQAIYGFRQGDPAALGVFGQRYGADRQLELSGNFRSSPAICGCSATLRARAEPDESLGENAAVTLPVYVLKYDGNTPPASIHIYFNNLAQQAGIPEAGRIVLAHARSSARNACGLTADTEGGDSKVARIARAGGTFHAKGTSGRSREACVCAVEEIILDLMGKLEDQVNAARAAEQHGIDRRWLRRVAMQLITSLPATCENSDDRRAAWVGTLREAVTALGLSYAQGLTVARYFRMPPSGDWSQFLLPGVALAPTKWATIHEAKGSEHGAVCVVIPPDRGGTDFTEQLISAWESRSDSESKRVIYVGVTRAEKLLVIAVPAAFSDRVAAVLHAGEVSFELHDPSIAVAVGAA